MKTQGAVNWAHALAWLKMHLTDAERQRLQKSKKAAVKFERRLTRLAKRMVKDGWSLPTLREASEATRGVTPADEAEILNGLKFPSLGLGVSFFREGLAGPWVDGKAPAGEWVQRGAGDTGAAKAWVEALGDWHSGYIDARGKARFFNVSPDERFQEMTGTLPLWDSEALRASLANGELSEEEFLDFIRRVRSRISDGTLERLISAGADCMMVLAAINVHPQDGVLHFHPVFLKTAPLSYRRADGTIQPRSQAPTGGRNRKGEGWVGGERLGRIGTDGKWITNVIGPAICATDALKAAGLPPPIEVGDDWSLFDDRLKKHTEGEKRDGTSAGGTKRARSDGLGVPADLWLCRLLREEVAQLATRNSRFRQRREAEIQAAKRRAHADNKALIAAVSPAVAASHAKLSERDKTIGKLTEANNMDKSGYNEMLKKVNENSALIAKQAATLNMAKKQLLSSGPEKLALAESKAARLARRLVRPLKQAVAWLSEVAARYNEEEAPSAVAEYVERDEGKISGWRASQIFTGDLAEVRSSLAPAELTGLEKDLAAFELKNGYAGYVISHGGQRWSLLTILEILERLAARNDKPEDVFLLNEYFCVEDEIIEQLQIFASDQNPKISTPARDALVCAELRNRRYGIAKGGAPTSLEKDAPMQQGGRDR